MTFQAAGCCERAQHMRNPGLVVGTQAQYITVMRAMRGDGQVWQVRTEKRRAIQAWMA